MVTFFHKNVDQSKIADPRDTLVVDQDIALDTDMVSFMYANIAKSNTYGLKISVNNWRFLTMKVTNTRHDTAPL
jgi:hypothetical protein